MSRKTTASPVSPKTQKSQYMLENQVGFLLRSALRRHTTIFMEQMVEKLTPPQFCVLAKLYEAGPLSQNYLGRLIASDSSTIKDIVDRMEAKKLVQTSADPSDLRLRSVQLTARGKALAEAAINAGKQITDDTLVPLTPAEKLVIVDILKKLS